MSATFVMLATTVCADGLPIKQSTNASSASLATGVNAGCFEPPYIFGGDGASAPEVLGQDPAEYACFSPRLSFPPVGSLSPELERADLVGPATCFGPPDPAGGYLGTESSGSPASSLSAASGGRRRSDRSSAARLRTRHNAEASARAAKAKPAAAGTERQTKSSRESHNQVEKQYRDRLNDQFQRLLATVALASQGDSDAMDDDNQRPLSKSAVLGLARRRLLVLEKENRQLSSEVERLTALLERIR